MEALITRYRLEGLRILDPTGDRSITGVFERCRAEHRKDASCV